MAERWVVAAEGTTFADLKQKLADRQIPSGTPIQVVFDFKVPYVAKLFDTAGAEQAFRPFLPPSTKLIDVYEEGGKGYVNMEATSPPLAAVITFISAHWVAIAIGAIVLTAVICAIRILIKITDTITDMSPVFLILFIVGIGLVVWSLVNNRGG